MAKANGSERLIQILAYGIGGILVLLPFHAVFTTWLGSNFGHLDLFRIWKELLLVPLAVGAFWIVYKDSQLSRWFRSSKLVYLIMLYILLHLVLGASAFIASEVTATALIYALLINLRFFVFFLLCLVVASKTPWLSNHWKQIILWPALIVVIFGLLQQFVLPIDVLKHAGYGPGTIPPYHTIDQKLGYARIQATLRGPNPLGAYLVVVITILVSFLLANKKKAKWLGGLAASFILLFFTYSRSAWLGVLTSGVLLVYWSVRSQKLRRWVLIGCGAVILLLGGLVITLRDNDFFQNTFFHTDESSRSAESSNEARTQAINEGAKSLVQNPFGRGPGTAGPASFRNKKPARIAENYYIQIGQEVGLAGLAVFIAINVLIARALWFDRKNPLSLVLLASLAGITVINMLSHAWADDTLAYIWWGLAGLALGARWPAGRQSR